jgi:hypothetical protein
MSVSARSKRCDRLHALRVHPGWWYASLLRSVPEGSTYGSYRADADGVTFSSFDSETSDTRMELIGGSLRCRSNTERPLARSVSGDYAAQNRAELALHAHGPEMPTYAFSRRIMLGCDRMPLSNKVSETNFWTAKAAYVSQRLRLPRHWGHAVFRGNTASTWLAAGTSSCNHSWIQKLRHSLGRRHGRKNPILRRTHPARALRRSYEQCRLNSPLAYVHSKQPA